MDSFSSDGSVDTSVQPEDKIHVSDERASSNVSDSQDPCVIDVGSGQTSPNKGEESAEVESAELSDMAEASGNLTHDEQYAALGTDGNACGFKRFDTAKDPLDHFFLGANVQVN